MKRPSQVKGNIWMDFVTEYRKAVTAGCIPDIYKEDQNSRINRAA